MGRRLVGVYVDPRVDREIEHLMVDSGRTKSDLYELGAKIVVELVRDGKLSEATRAELVKLMQALAAAARTAEAEARG